MESSNHKNDTNRTGSVMKSLFTGVLDLKKFTPYPKMNPDEQENVSMMLDSVQEFYRRKVDSAKIDREALIPDEVLQGMREMGLFGLSIPVEYGGLGLSTTGYARVMEEVGALDASLAATLGAHHSIGLKGLLLYGTEAQKQKYLPRLAKGEMIAAFALTEPSAGSDAAGLQMQAQLSSDGKSYILNGNKIWISNGGIADLFTVFARTANSKEGKPKITAFIVERAFGVKSGPQEHKLGIRGSATNALYFEDVKIPIENVLGEVSQGFKVAMGVLNNGRLGLSAITLGGCKKLIQLVINHVNERKAFGRLIGEFDLIKEKIARLMAETFALESMTYLTTSLVDGKEVDYSIESAICKIFGSETVWMVANEALQVAAGSGYMQNYPFERLLRDSRIAMIFEGTNEILRSFIALTGIQKPGKELEEVKNALHAPFAQKKQLGTFIRRKLHTLTRQECLPGIHPQLQSANRILAEYIGKFSWNVDSVLRKYGSGIVENQFLQLRLAEMGIALYGLLATLSRTQQIILQKGEQEAQHEIDLCLVFAGLAGRRLEKQHRDFYSNDDTLQRKVASDAYRDGKYTPHIF